ERGLDLVEEVERRRPRQEEREQERERAQRLLATGQEREPSDPLAGRAQPDLDSRLGVLVLALQLGLGQLQQSLAAGEERRRDLGDRPLDRLEGGVEARIDRVREPRAQVLELGEALLEILALLDELCEPLLLTLVLLLGERVHLADGLEPALRARQLLDHRLTRLVARLDRLIADAARQLVGLAAPAGGGALPP